MAKLEDFTNVRIFRPEHGSYIVVGNKKPLTCKEDEFQIEITKFLDDMRSFHFHYAAERQLWTVKDKRGRSWSPAGVKLKRKGVKKGLPDTFIMDPYIDPELGQCPGIVIELKVEGGEVDEDQRIRLESLRIRGWRTIVAWNYDICQLLADIHFNNKIRIFD